MATENKNLSKYNKEELPDASNFKFAIITSDWNSHVTHNLKAGAEKTLVDLGAEKENILQYNVPGSFELVYAADKIIEKYSNLSAVIVIGCVIKGETSHFEYVCQGVTQGVKDLNLKHKTLTIFCVLTDENEQQSIDRSGGKYGNKGIEAAVAAVIMAHFKHKTFE